MSIENPTLVHFRHFRSLLNNEIRNTQYEIRSTKDYVRNYKQNMQNKANFQKSQMNVSNGLTMNYEQMDTWSGGKNKPNSKPIQTQFKANSNPIQTQYKPNSNPISSPQTAIFTQFIINELRTMNYELITNKANFKAEYCLMIILLYCISAYFIRKSRTWKNSQWLPKTLENSTLQLLSHASAHCPSGHSARFS